MNLKEVEELLYDIFNLKFKVIVITEEEWLIEKQKYINNINEGKKYNYIFEEEVKEKENLTNSINDLMELVGTEVVEFK